MRQITQAILRYSVENNGYVLPWHFNTAEEGESRRGTTWATVLQREGFLPDLKSLDNASGTVLACPSRNQIDHLSSPKVDRIHYGYNVFPGFDTQFNMNWANSSRHKITAVSRPSETLCLGEMNGSYRLYPNQSTDRIYPHSEGMNITYFDGRTDWVAKPLPVIPRTETVNTAPWW